MPNVCHPSSTSIYKGFDNCRFSFIFRFPFLVNFDQKTKRSSVIFLFVYVFIIFVLPVLPCKIGTHGNENHATYFLYFGSFDQKPKDENMR